MKEERRNLKKTGLVILILVTLTISPSITAQIDIWSDRLEHTGDTFLYLNSTETILIDAGTNFSSDINISGNVVPAFNTTSNLGSNLLHWNNVFAKIYYGDGSKLTGITGGDGYAGGRGHPHNQDLNTTSDVTFNSVSGDGSGLTGISGDGYAGGKAHPHDQDLNTTNAVIFTTVDTGQGANELYDMDQNVLTTSDVTFNSITGIGASLTNLPNIFNQWLNTTDNTTFDWLDITNDINISGNVVPTVNTSSNLGSNLLHWLHVYADTYYANGGDSSQWNTAYGWGDHSVAGYLTSTGNPFNQDLNTTDSPTFGGLTLTSYSGILNFINGIAYSDAGVNNLSDVDTATEAPSKHDVLMWNGSAWVCVPEETVFTFSIASFSDGESTTQLIGSGTWEADSTMSYTASYNNGPPITADVNMSNNGGAYSKIGEMTAPAYTSGTNSEGAINYPASKDQYLRFRLYATDGEDQDTDIETAIYFRNYLYWGDTTTASGFTEANVEALPGSQITNDFTQSKSITAGASEYIAWAYPASYTNLDEGDDYEDDGGTDFRFDGIAIAITRDTTTLSINNFAGYTENYEVYVSDLANLGSGTFMTSTSDLTIDPLYYGITTKTDTFTEADIEGLGTNEITNDNTQVWDAVTTGEGEYMLFAFPKRLGTVEFWVGGFEGGFEDPETVSVTNSNGWTEDYYAWRSTNSNLGETVVETK